jgi:hypothetical protein
MAPAITPPAFNEVDDVDSSLFGATLVFLIDVNNGDFIEVDLDETEEKAFPEPIASRKSAAPNL